MFVQFPVLFSTVLQQLILVLNTTLLIILLAVMELSDSSWLPGLKKYLRDFYPLLAVLIGLLAIAVFKQLGVI